MADNAIRPLAECLKELYVREINVSLSSFFDGGWEVRFGDRTQGFENSDDFTTIGDVEKYLTEYLAALPPLTTTEKLWLEK